MAGTLITSTLQGTTLTDGTNSTSTTNCIQGSAKAWVKFDGNGSISGVTSYNVSSVVRNSTGNYTVNFTNSLADANYSTVMSNSNISSDGSIWINKTISQSASNVQFGNINVGNIYNDVSYLALVVFR